MSRRNTPSGSPRREHGTPSRWDQYWALLVAKRIPQQAQRWYVTHVQDFLDAVQPNSLKDLSREEMTGYLQQTSSQGKWQDWQFRQVVDALQLLLVDLAGVKAAQLVDWDYWREAGAVLPADHPTIAREQVPEARLAEPKFAASAEVFPVLTSLARTLRTKQYSIRTEQTLEAGYDIRTVQELLGRVFNLAFFTHFLLLQICLQRLERRRA